VVEIKGLEKFAPRDFPGFISATVFLPGCNFRCPFCHNAELVFAPEGLATIPMDFFVAFLDSRKDWLEGICVTGGEPLLAPDLESFLAVIKERGLLVKLDTNGSAPERLESVVRAGLADRVAMDVKAPAARYAEVAGAFVDPADIERSAGFLRDAGVDHMLRTTVVPGLVGYEDVLGIGQWLGGAPVFQLQQFSPVGVRDPIMAARKPFSPDEIRAMADAVRARFDTVLVEGV
jgi:pyruvate formate lyase activating enzyme